MFSREAGDLFALDTLSGAVLAFTPNSAEIR